jgi:hypothetical protein
VRAARLLAIEQRSLRPGEVDVERVPFALVANRALDPTFQAGSRHPNCRVVAN